MEFFGLSNGVLAARWIGLAWDVLMSPELSLMWSSSSGIPSLPVARLYSVGFYGAVRQRLNPGAVVVTQASAPFLTPRVLASIQAGLQQVGLKTRPYSVTIPTFGPWGFVMARPMAWSPQYRSIPFPTRWIDADQLAALFAFPRDFLPSDSDTVQANRMTRPVLLDYQRTDRRRRLLHPLAPLPSSPSSL